MQKVRFYSILCHDFNPLNKICRFKSLKPCRSVSVVLDLKKVAVFPLQHYNKRSHISFKTQVDITKFIWTDLTHPPYSTDLAHSHFNLLWDIKDAIRQKICGNDDEILQEIKWLPVQERLDILVIFFLLDDSPVSGFYVPTFRNTLSVPYSVLRNIGTQNQDAGNHP